jgi:hypothetical protein
MSGDPRIPDGSRAILIAVPHYQDAKYGSYTAVGNSVDGMYQLLVESGLCGWRKEQVKKITDTANAGQLMGRLRRLAAETTGVLLLYFVGHGQPSEHTGELCLAIADTDHANPDSTGLEYTKIKRMLHSGTPATTRIAILDCCYSGTVIGLGTANDGTQLAELSDCAGAYTLTAADERAHVPADDKGNLRTAFTGELLDLLTRDGIPGGPTGLTLGTIFPRLRHRLATKGLPLPNQRSDDSAAAFVFARNVVPAEASDDPAERLRAELAASEQRYEARLHELHQSIVRLRQEGRAVDPANGQQRDLRQAVEQARRDKSEAATALLLRNQELTRLRDALVIVLRRPAALAAARAHSLHTAESSAQRGNGEQQTLPGGQHKRAAVPATTVGASEEPLRQDAGRPQTPHVTPMVKDLAAAKASGATSKRDDQSETASPKENGKEIVGGLVALLAIACVIAGIVFLPKLFSSTPPSDAPDLTSAHVEDCAATKDGNPIYVDAGQVEVNYKKVPCWYGSAAYRVLKIGAQTRFGSVEADRQVCQGVSGWDAGVAVEVRNSSETDNLIYCLGHK